ncbi:MAG: SwmB domain-containing protein, partial [Candidatus Nanopelagicaceae bacterium]
GNGGSGIVIIRYTPDVTGPAISSATVTSNGSSLELLFNETLSATTAPANSFTVSRTLFGGSSDTITVSSLSSSGSTVTLILASTIFAGDTVTVSYVDPSGSDDTNALQDLVGNDVASFSNQSVTNNSTEKQSQSPLTITSTTVAYGDDLTLTTSGGSGTGTLTFDVDTGNCIIQGSTLFSSSVGNCTVTATKAADTNYLAESATAVITITSGSATLTIAFSSTTFTFGVTNPITVTVSAAGTVRFSANGRVIKNCKAISTIPNLGIASGGMTYRATCNYRPGTRGPLKITARLTPTDLNIAPRSSTSAQFVVLRRTGVRG